MKPFKLREAKIDFPNASLTIDQMATELDILIDVYKVDSEEAFQLDFAERHLLLKSHRKATNGKLEPYVDPMEWK